LVFSRRVAMARHSFRRAHGFSTRRGLAWIQSGRATGASVRRGGMTGRAPLSQMRLRGSSEAKPRSPTTHPGAAGKRPGGSRAIGGSCPCPGASAKARARPRPSAITRALCHGRRENGQMPHGDLALGYPRPFRAPAALCGARRVAPSIKTIPGAIPRCCTSSNRRSRTAPPGPAGEQPRRQPPGTRLGRDAAPPGPVPVPPEDRRKRPPRLLRRRLAARLDLFNQRLPYRPGRVRQISHPLSISHAANIGITVKIQQDLRKH
jgi:hypothetical protein